MNIPNILTVLRILLAPLFMILLLKEMPGYALVVFTAAGISDGLDGFIARYTNQRTVLGSYLDPLADKLLLITAYVSLAVLHIIPSWLSVLVICRDVIILIGIAVFSITGVPVNIKPSIPSKFTTVSQLTTIFLSLLNTSFSFQPVLFQILIWITAGLTILSGLHYIFLGLGILQNGGKPNRQKNRS
ncbi:MAG: CDP-alcohol phosphatidyltransferase family protein [Thermodesulfobacteriota bacterium]